MAGVQGSFPWEAIQVNNQMTLQMEASNVKKVKRDGESEFTYKHKFKPQADDIVADVEKISIDTRGERLAEEGDVMSVEEIALQLERVPSQSTIDEHGDQEDE